MAEQLIPFGPWRGSVTAREKISLKTDELGPDSINWLISPEDGRLIRRGGSQIQVDTLSGGAEATGLVYSAATPSTSEWRASQFIALHSPSITDGYESPAWLVRSETNKTGTLSWLSRNDSSFHQLGEEYNATSTGHYRQDGAAGEVRMKVVPYVYSTDTYGRFQSNAARQYPFAGSRRVMELDSGVYSPGADACPYWWNKRFNDAGTSGTERMRGQPWGLYPPLWAPTTTSNTTVTGYNWQDGDTFWEAWAFKFADGSIGPLFKVSPTAASAAGGLITVGTVTGTAQFDYRTISNIPLGPKGPIPCVGRVGFRTAKIHRKLTTDANPSPDVFYPFAIINDNITTTYLDYSGSDENLTTSASAFFDQTWPPSAQGAVAVDGRTVMFGEIKPNPYAMIIAPTGTTSTRDRNLDDENTSVLYQTTFYHVRITTTNLYLKKTTGGATTTATIDFATYDTLQKIVDRINTSTVAGIGGSDCDEWAAQLAPGVEPNTAATALRPTTAIDEDTVGAGVADGTTGNIRAYCPQFPFVAAFTEAYIAKFPVDYTGIWLSQGASSTGDNVYSQFRIAEGHRKQPPGLAVGKVLGVEPCTGANGIVAIVFYERARFALRNTKSGGSRENPDYNLVPLDQVNGCISHLSCFNGPGFAGCVGLDGLWVTDGSQGLVLTRDHLDEFPAPGQLSGALAYGIRTDAALAAKGSDTYTWVGVIGDKIRIRYRSNQSTNLYCDRGMDYWFGRGENAAGLSALFKIHPDGRRSLYGWSCQNVNQNVGVHGMFTDSTGRRVFAWQETNAAAKVGRVDEVDMASVSDDNDTDFGSSGFTACVLAGDFEEIGILRCDPMWRSNNSTLLVIPYVDVNRNESVSTLTLGSSGTSVMKRQMFEFDLNARAHKQAIEFKILDAGDGSGAVEVYKLPVTVDVSKAGTRF